MARFRQGHFSFDGMTESTALQDLDAGLSSGYLFVRETPHGSGFSTFAARSREDGSNVEIKAVPLETFGRRPVPASLDPDVRKLQHPNIVPILKLGSHGRTFYWMSPEIEGRTLRSRMSRGGRIGVQDSLTILRDVSAALSHAHSHGVVHGGLSPDSIIIGGGSALVSDIGIAPVFAALRHPTADRLSTPTGTEQLRYAAPEQASDAAADTRVDAYSWGVIAYEILSGRHPFAGRSTPREVMSAHADEVPSALAPQAGDVPAGVTRLVMQCLSKEPSKRPETARHIRDAMSKAMLADPAPPAAGTGQKVVIGLMVLAVALIVAIAWLGMRS